MGMLVSELFIWLKGDVASNVTAGDVLAVTGGRTKSDDCSVTLETTLGRLNGRRGGRPADYNTKETKSYINTIFCFMST